MEYQRLKKVDIAYFAGLLDGEGCVRIGKFTNSSGELRYRAYIQVGMTDKQPIQWLQDTFGGGLYKATKKNLPLHKPCYVWSINANDGAKLLLEAMPYLKVKGEQAKIFIEFSKTLTGPGGMGVAKPIPTSLLEQRAWWYSENKKLNKKGIDGIS